MLKKQILIVEDETTLRKILCDKFVIEGFEVLEAKNGEIGLEVAIEKNPDLIILDNIMPVMDGMTMMKKFRMVSDLTKKIPIILLSNLSMDNEMGNRPSEEDQYSYYFVKSNWSIRDLLKKVRELI